jgi:hypothetical protein
MKQPAHAESNVSPLPGQRSDPIEQEMAQVVASRAPTATIAPPLHGDSARDAINSIVTGLTEQVGHDISVLRRKIDQLEQMTLINAAKTKADLEQTVTLCRTVKDEIGHIDTMVDRMMADVGDKRGRRNDDNSEQQ